MAAEGSRQEAPPVEPPLRDLLLGYARALQFAWDMPVLGRARVAWNDDKTSARWGSRWLTRLYLETHVRKQLRAIRICLKLELLGSTIAETREQMRSLEVRLADALDPLLGWRRVFGLVARLPTVAASLPVVSAFVALPLGGSVSLEEVLEAGLVLAGTALAIWIVLVWPSIRLGFRIKRAILSGGSDRRHPILKDPYELRWEGFLTKKGYETAAAATLIKFPDRNVYELENEVFRALGRRKPPEVPIDMLLALGPYLGSAGSLGAAVMIPVAAVSYGLTDTIHWALLVSAPLLAGVPVQIVLQARRNYRGRKH
jgi:hypothetical protein